MEENCEIGVFDRLSKPLRNALLARGFREPTEPQEKAIPEILNGQNVLLIAPTGTGKTEAAFLPVLDRYLLTPERRTGIMILYITPLRALNRDLLGRLEWWCGRLDIPIAVRHGDTEKRERTRQSLRPPHLLITTPETLQAVLPGRVMSRHLRAVRWVIIDEIHELAADKRGSQLSLSLERLRLLTRKDFQVVGLSATIGSPDLVAKFLVGTGRDYQIVRVPVARRMELKIHYPEPKPEDAELAKQLFTYPEVAARLKLIRDILLENRSVLLFTNTRAVAEILASRFRVWDPDFPVSIHHSSLSKPARLTAESGLKNGELKGLVCTSSLELGIDVGRIDLCIQYNSPRQVTRLLQRVGRSGHRIGRLAKGAIIALNSEDTLESMVIARRALEENLETVLVPEKPLDVINQQVVGMLISKSRWYLDEILEILKRSYPYRDLTEEDLIKILIYMHERYPRLAFFSLEERIIAKPRRSKDLYTYYYENLSMIPDQKNYLIIDESNNTPVGILDEAFVAEHGQPGVKFIIRGRPWKIGYTYSDKIYVNPIDDPTGAIPSWVGEQIPVPFDVAVEVGKIRSYIEEEKDAGHSRSEIISTLVERYPASIDVVDRAVADTLDQINQDMSVPTDTRITIEEWDEYIVIHASFGSLVNRTLAQLIGHILAERLGHTVGVQQDPYRIVVQTFGEATVDDIMAVLSTLPIEEVKEITTKAVVKTGLFKRRLIHAARKFGALSKGVDFGTVSLRQLMKSFEGSVIYDQALIDTWRTDLDIDRTLKILREVQTGDIDIVEVEIEKTLTPIGRVGIEKLSRRTTLIPAEKLRGLIIQSAKARLLNEAMTLVCTSCRTYVETRKTKEIEKSLVCPNCQENEIGGIKMTKDDVLTLMARSSRDRRRARMIQQVKESSKLYKMYGVEAFVALAGRRLRLSQVEKILKEESILDERFFELVVEAEREAMRRGFW
jgi:ATP-dependent Lhr-like helicase